MKMQFMDVNDVMHFLKFNEHNYAILTYRNFSRLLWSDNVLFYYILPLSDTICSAMIVFAYDCRHLFPTE